MTKKCFHVILVVFFLIKTFSHTTSLVLSDLPTPSFIVDLSSFTKTKSFPQNNNDSTNTKTLHKTSNRIVDGTTNRFQKDEIPAFYFSDGNITIYPKLISNNDNDESKNVDCTNIPILDVLTLDTNITDIDENLSMNCFYVHSSVIRGKQDFVSKENMDDVSPILAEIDLYPSLLTKTKTQKNTDNFCNNKLQQEDNEIPVMPAYLCLGLNNHHVGGYYWARSSGSGASMEAPGIIYTASESLDEGEKGILRWSCQKNGITLSNSNDGKRSEWVNFLRKGDTVQLVPKNAMDCLWQFINYQANQQDRAQMKTTCSHIYGVSFRNRPLGSDPEVICEWRRT